MEGSGWAGLGCAVLVALGGRGRGRGHGSVWGIGKKRGIRGKEGEGDVGDVIGCLFYV